jgi:hypothetical protein
MNRYKAALGDQDPGPTSEIRDGRGQSPSEPIATLRHGQNAETPQINLEDGDYINTLAQEKQSSSHYRYKQSPTILKVILNTPIAAAKNN